MLSSQAVLLTTSNAMHLVLDKKVYHGHKGAKKGRGQVLSVLDRFRIRRAEGDAAKCPRDRNDQVRDHQDVVPVMVVGRGDVGPAATGQCAQQSHRTNKLWQRLAGLRSEQIPQTDQGKSRTCSRLAHQQRRILLCMVASHYVCFVSTTVATMEARDQDRALQ